MSSSKTAVLAGVFHNGCPFLSSGPMALWTGMLAAGHRGRKKKQYSHKYIKEKAIDAIEWLIDAQKQF